MLKRVFYWVLVFVAFANAGCHKAEQKEHASLPSMQITMTPAQWDSVLADRDNKVSARAILLDAQGDTLYQGKLAYIKTRGNFTFTATKKSFSIKFPHKQNLFGLSLSKSFVLLANAFDESHIRNAIALDLATAFGIPASRYVYLTLYVNGVYKGLYQMTNKVDVGKRTLGITDLEKMNERANPKPLKEYEWFGKGRKKQVIQRKGVLLDNNPDDITGGYLLDITGPWIDYTKSISGFVSDAEDNIRIRSPQYASPQEVDYIAERYNEMEAAVHAADGIHPITGKHYTEYLDMDSFVRYYLFNELIKNLDGGWSSFMIYKNNDTNDPKFYAGPAWDYDRSLDNPSFQTQKVSLVNEFYVNAKNGIPGMANSGGLFYYLFKHEDFRRAVKDCYQNEISPACHEYLETGSFDSLSVLLSHEADQDNKFFPSRHAKNYEDAVSRATGFLRKSLEFIDWFYATTEDERVTVNYIWIDGSVRKLYYPLEQAIDAPQLDVLHNHTPVYELYYAGTDSLVPQGTVFHTSQELELRKREPTRREVQTRRIRKKIKKIGF